MRGNTQEYVKVKCMSCGRRYYLYADELPDDELQGDEAIPSLCPFCREGTFAVPVLQK